MHTRDTQFLIIIINKHLNDGPTEDENNEMGTETEGVGLELVWNEMAFLKSWASAI